ncbi:hypothetical protein AB1M95_14405 [Sulfitobacter sp. LCG007]
MESGSNGAQSASRVVLGIAESGVPDFVIRQIGKRRFSGTVAELNRDMLSGTPEQKALARKALDRLGFPSE